MIVLVSIEIGQSINASLDACHCSLALFGGFRPEIDLGELVAHATDLGRMRSC